MAGLYRAVANALKEAGWFRHHQGKGSHELWRHEDHPEGLEIAVPANLKKVFTAESIMKQAGLSKDAYTRGRRKAQR